MNDKEFWKIVKTVNWGKDFDYERIKFWMLENLSPEQIAEFRRIASEKWNQLDKMIGDRNPAQGGDDSHSDLLYHVIGLGKKEFEASLEDYMRLARRGEAIYNTPEGYVESFAYCIPYEDDIKKNNDPDHFPNWAKTAKTEIHGLIEMDSRNDLDPIFDEFELIDESLDKVIEGNIEGFIEDADEILASLDKIDKFFSKNYMELPRKFTDNNFNGYNIHFVKNLLRDIIKKQEVTA